MSRSGAVRARMMAFSFLDGAGPLITLHTLWFVDHGVTAGQISAVFVLWAALGVLLEVPSGALADRTDRRRLLAGATLLRAVGLALWLLWPTLGGLVVGAVLWAVHGALVSGTWEALIYDELDALGEVEDYQRTHARIEQATTAGVAAGTVGAAVLLWSGVPLVGLGVVTVSLHAPAWWAVRTLPAVPIAASADEDDEDDGQLTLTGWWRTLRAGVRQVTERPATGRLVIIAGALGGLMLMDEYVPLLGRARGASDAEIAGLVLAVWLGGLLGSEAAARLQWSSRAVALTLLLATSVAIGGLLPATWLFLPVLGLGFAAQCFAWLYADARLQERLDSASRATATSVRELLSNGVSVLILSLVGWLSVGEDPSRGVGVMLVGVALVALLLARWRAEGG